MKSIEIRKQFLQYFADHQHAIVASASLIPGNDPTLLFTNAGMVPFKDVFLGKEQRNYVRATSSQRCVRAGGKHNDLENVGYTARHHTFFEMLGNFSFGDYFKREAIKFAWSFLTEVLGLPSEKLWITVYVDDQESADIWLKEMKVSPERFSRCGEKDNFWSMGDTGPCGPCTEIFYDHGPEIPGGPPGSPDEDGDRYIEIWNLVFMQYNRLADGTLSPLQKQSVDTGMGLERLAAVLQGKHNNYDTDLFVPIISQAARLLGVSDVENQSLRVIADHIRSTAFLIMDGVRPSNEGRGYVLRRITRRAIRHGHKLGCKAPFFFKLLEPLSQVMGEAYPELIKQQNIIQDIIAREETQFAVTLEQGLHLLEQELDHLSGGQIPGEVMFKLYDTYGFPVDLTADIARERGLRADMLGFEAAMAEQRERSKAGGQFQIDLSKKLAVSGQTTFLGYDDLRSTAKVVNLFCDEQAVDTLSPGQQGIVVLDQTPFYAESGGQVGDIGYLRFGAGEFQVLDTRKQGNVFLHVGQVIQGELKMHSEVNADVDPEHRRNVKANHSATHLLHAALQHVLGEHVVQKGSLVSADYLRFDFAHPQSLTKQELSDVEAWVNQEVAKNNVATTELMTPEEAKAAGAMALFGEKYGETVRVLSLGEHSKELCGGTHVDSTGVIGLFKIVRESSIAAGIRRIEAYTGATAEAYVKQLEAELKQEVLQQAQRITSLRQTIFGLQEKLGQQLVDLNDFDINVLPELYEEKYQEQQVLIKKLEKTVDQLQTKLSLKAGDDLVSKAVKVNNINLLSEKVKVSDAKALRPLLDELRHKLSPAIVVLAAVNGEQVSLIAGVDKTLTTQFHAGKLINFVAGQLGGKGGGRPDMAQAGAKHPEKLAEVLKSVHAWVEKELI